MTYYLVGHPEDERLSLYCAETPEEALREHIDETGEDGAQNVWTAREVLPEIDIFHALMFCGSDAVPDGGWIEHVGKERVEGLQSYVDDYIRTHFSPYYITDEVVLRHRPDEVNQ